MKISSYSRCGPVAHLWKQYCILGYSKSANYSAPLVYLQRPKWIVDDKDWEIIVNSVTMNLPAGFEINKETK